MTGVVIGIKIFVDTGDTAPLLIAAFFAEVPQTFASGFMGILADRFNRRYVIMLGDLGQAIGTTLLLISFGSGQFQLWHLYIAMLVQGLFATVQGPASQATITMLVPENQRDRANGVRQIGFPLAGIVAPVLAGVLYTLIDVTGVMLIDLATFIVAMIVVALIALPPHPQNDETDEAVRLSWREMLAGWRFLWQRRMLFILAVYISFIYFLINGPLELATPYLIAITGSKALLGVLLGALNLGAFLGAASIAVIGNVGNRVRVILAAFLLHGVMLIGWGIARDPLLIGVISILLMFPLAVVGALFATILQNKTPSHLQGRVFGVTDQMGVMLTPLSFLITAGLVDQVLEPAAAQVGDGMSLLMIGVGGIIIALTLLVFLQPSIRRLEQTLPTYGMNTLNDSEATAPARNPPD
jgi:MFS family permease